jgi:hypothetical protein
VKETLATGARSNEALMAVGEKRHKIAECTYQAFYEKKRAQIVAEDAFEADLLQKAQQVGPHSGSFGPALDEWAGNAT